MGLRDWEEFVEDVGLDADEAEDFIAFLTKRGFDHDQLGPAELFDQLEAFQDGEDD